MHFLLKTRMTPETWARLLANPEDRLKKAKEGAADFGGEQLGYWYSAGRYDVYSLLAAPDVVTAGALHSRLFSSGGFIDFEPVTLLTVEEMKEAVTRAEKWPSFNTYRTPGGGEGEPNP